MNPESCITHEYGSLCDCAKCKGMRSALKTTVRQVFTFGCGQPNAGKYHVIEAESKEECTRLMYLRFDQKWSMQYNSEEEAGVERWGLEQII